MIVIEKIVYYFQFPGEESLPCHVGKHWGGQDVGVGRACGHIPLLGFLLEGRGKAGQAGLGWASLSNFSRL